jgi:hypothetical protein
VSPVGAPHSIRRKHGTEDSIQLSWKSPSIKPSATTFVVYHLDSDADVNAVWSSTDVGSKTSATLRSLKPGKTYQFKVAAVEADHSKQFVSDAIAFSTLRKGRETFWIETYRVSENNKTTPDYLANHNSGSASGDTAFLTATGGGARNATPKFFSFDTSPRVRYCVEIEVVDLSNISR